MTAKIEWIGLRPERRAEVRSVTSVQVDSEHGLIGDHQTADHRQVTIISMEDLEKVRETMGADHVDPAAARRNIVISAMDFSDLKGTRLQLGSDAIIEITGYCHPCKRMDENFGDGGRKALAHKAGWTAKVIASGTASVGDEVKIV